MLANGLRGAGLAGARADAAAAAPAGAGLAEGVPGGVLSCCLGCRWRLIGDLRRLGAAAAAVEGLGEIPPCCSPASCCFVEALVQASQNARGGHAKQQRVRMTLTSSLTVGAFTPCRGSVALIKLR